MAYTVKKLAALSGVSVRTLHFYDEVGLLKPAYQGANGYRFYEEPQLLTLQQIRFYRELGFELKQIKRILGRAEFEKLAALESHRKVLKKNLARTRALLVTIDKTIEHLKGTKPMQSNELLPASARKCRPGTSRPSSIALAMEQEGIAQTKARVKDWTKADWQRSGENFNRICRDLASAIEQKERRIHTCRGRRSSGVITPGSAVLEAEPPIVHRPRPAHRRLRTCARHT